MSTSLDGHGRNRPLPQRGIGWGAYFVAAGKALGWAPVPLTVQLDGRRPVRRWAMVCRIGSVGNLTLVPGASPFDGLLDLYIASPHRLVHWLKLGLRLVTGRPQKDDQVDQHTGTTVTVIVHGSDTYQLDGDVVGAATRMTAHVKPGALIICVPTTTSAPTLTSQAPMVTDFCAAGQDGSPWSSFLAGDVLGWLCQQFVIQWRLWLGRDSTRRSCR